MEAKSANFKNCISNEPCDTTKFDKIEALKKHRIEANTEFGHENVLGEGKMTQKEK